jgi:hypothetical protein
LFKQGEGPDQDPDLHCPRLTTANAKNLSLATA